MNSMYPPSRSLDRLRTRTPMRCPVCGNGLNKVLVRDLGSPSPSITWQVHAGQCEEHGWFQTEIVSRPPREIFAVTKPFGAARRLVIKGKEYYSFSTAWNDLPGEERRKPTDPLEEKYWQTRPLN